MRLLLGVLVLLTSLSVRAQPELPLPGSIKERVMVVWGGGRTREEAESFVQSYQERSVDWARVVEAGPGYPRIVDGTDLPGLRPGYFFVVLGVCEAQEGEAVAKVFKALEPRSYSRRVLWEERDALACPSLLPGWSFGKSTQMRVTGGTLMATTFQYEGEEGPRAQRSWLMILALLKKDDVESSVIEPPEDEVQSEVKGLRLGRGEVVLEEVLTHPTCDTQPRAEVYSRTWHFSVQRGAVVTKQVKKLLRKTDCAAGEGGAAAENG
ncbi:hypothetical protein JRI60_46690 [Archangium violaceum]|uniref:hypothetical protein n=1 Tax=Archangium violaceum TaxID=83451 RepID=UPI00194E7A55|nr:hypothetical protein [Archangium violaceum]QRN96422.1 hypothetical protein JRI60_46690 [Archangium violaceum]